MAVQHRQQHGQVVALEPHRQAPGAGATTINQGLDLHQQGRSASSVTSTQLPGTGLACWLKKMALRLDTP